MASADSSAGIRIDVTHATRRLSLSFPVATATIWDLREALQSQLGIPHERQRLFFGPPVPKDRRREEHNDTRLAELMGPLNTSLNNPSHAALGPIPLMLIGTAATAPRVDEAAVAQLRRLVCRTVEEGNRWFRCSYGLGYARQTAFVCRTCVDAGRADPAHAVCYACAEVCHDTHDVEEWGVRTFMRCDCCTSMCWRQTNKDSEKEKSAVAATTTTTTTTITTTAAAAAAGEASAAVIPSGRCRFVVDSATGEPPDAMIIPLNRRNRHPRRLYTWCYCEDDHPSDDPECGGVVCMLCASCYWSVHLTRLHSAQYQYMPCYGDVIVGDIVAFDCRTCDTLVCTPCRLRCHRDHDVDETFIFPSLEDGTDNNAPEGAHFSCGCRGCCAIAETVPRIEPEVGNEIVSPSAPVPAALALELMNSDAFMGIVCAHCMQEHPWLTTGDPRRCHNGQIPKKVPQSEQLPIVPCGLAADAPIPAGHFPFHAMLLPADAFAPEVTCDCPPCRAALERFAPRAEVATTARDMMVQLHNQCDHCGRTLREERAFMCQTCELQEERTYIVCGTCNARRIETEMPTPGMARPGTDVARVENPESMTDTNPMADTHNETEGDGRQRSGTEVPPWDHPLTHVFLEDTFENLYELCGMQIMNSLNTASREYALNSMDESRASLEGALRRTFSETPLVLDSEDLAQHQQERMRSLKRKREGNDTGDEKNNNNNNNNGKKSEE